MINQPRYHRRRMLVAAATLALALLVPTALASATPGGRVVIKTPFYPAFATTGYGAVWVGGHRGPTLYRIDQHTNKVTTTIHLGFESICGATSGFGAILVDECSDVALDTMAVSARTHKIVRRFQGGLAIADYGSLWTVNNTGALVLRFDPQSGVRLATIPTSLNDGVVSGCICESLGGAAGAVWLGDQTAKTVLRIDAATNKVVAVIPLPGAASQPSPRQGYATGAGMAYAGGKVWYGNPAGIYEIDPTTNTATLLPVRIGALWAWGVIRITATGNRVFVRTSGSAVTEIDASSGNVVRTYPATGGGGAPAVGYGSLWVPNAASDTTWREPLGA